MTAIDKPTLFSTRRGNLGGE